MSALFLGPLIVAFASGIALAVLTLAANLLEQSGPIRLRSWSEEAGSELRSLYQKRGRFDAFRFLLRVLAGASGLLLLVALVAIGGSLEIRDPLRTATLSTLLLLVVCEWGSRHLVGRDPEAALTRSTGIYRLLRWILSPLLPAIAAVLPNPRSVDEDTDEASPGEIDAFIDVGRREGILEPDEGELLRGLVDFGDTLVRSVMTPRIDVVAASIETTTEELIDLVLDSGHSRIPIYRDSIDSVIGILHVRDLVRTVRAGGDIEEYLQPTHFVPETKSLTELLRELQERHQELAVVVDEYGGTEGVVTIEDLLEEIFGEIVDEHDDEEPLEVSLPDGSWRVDGRLPLVHLGGEVAVETTDRAYETVGGLVFDILGRVPEVGDRVEAFGLRFLVEAADSRSARRVRVQPIEVEGAEVPDRSENATVVTVGEGNSES